MFERTDPQTLRMWLIIAAIVYFLLPFDLFPDMFGIPGRIDDLALMGALAWFYRNQVQRSTRAGSAYDAAGDSARREQQTSSRTVNAPATDAYAVLGIPRNATSDAIKRAYHARMQEYHPDKVAHLGEELQQVALEKTKQIQRAYQELQD